MSNINESTTLKRDQNQYPNAQEWNRSQQPLNGYETQRIPLLTIKIKNNSPLNWLLIYLFLY